MEKDISIRRNLSRRLFPIALGIWLLISFGFPALYFGLESRAMKHDSALLAKDLSEHLRSLILDAPSLWKYRTTKFTEVLHDFRSHQEISSMTILDEKGRTIAHFERDGSRDNKSLISPQVGSAPLFFNNRSVGTVQVSLSAGTLFHTTLLLLLFCSMVGGGLAAVVYLYPDSAFKTMEERIINLVRAIRSSGAESERLRIAAQNSEQKFRDLLQGIEAVVWEADASTLIFTFVSKRAEKILGYPVEEWLHPTFRADHIHPKDREDILSLLTNIKEEGKAYEFEYRVIASDNRILWVRDQVRLFNDPESGKGQLRGLMIDITGRKRVVEALAEERNLLAVTLRSIQDGVFTTDSKGRVILMNDAAEQLTGWKRNEATGKNLNDIFKVLDERTGGRITVPFEQVGDERAFSRTHGPKIIVSRDGTERMIEEITAPVYDSEARAVGMVLVFTDVTEKRRSEEELLKIQKLESIGVLAGGIAHDFNNLLTSLMGNLSLAKMYSPGEIRALERLEDAEKACLRAQDLTMQLLTFSKGGAPVKKLASIVEILKESANFALRGSPVSCRFFIAADLLPAEVDVGQISQVFHNIIINASQAMPNGGIIEISVENLSPKKAGEIPLTPRHYVKISIRDHGVGIPADHLQKIFDPYFTTKQKGSGLGLATSYSIISRHNGYITVESGLGVGATFHIYLPASQKTIPDSVDQRKKLFAGRGRILVMDDEDIMRLIVGNMLEELGYAADFAEDGEKALEKYMSAMEEGRPFDAVIIDLTIRGGGGGADCIKGLLATDPEVKAVVSSGYYDDPVMSNYRTLGFKGVITKPYKIEDLSEILYKTIHGVTRQY
jgi:two-component system cell cycle sensor histidine kinase/response regulator CckA